jgi:hypothetical protein
VVRTDEDNLDRRYLHLLDQSFLSMLFYSCYSS